MASSDPPGDLLAKNWVPAGPLGSHCGDLGAVWPRSGILKVSGVLLGSPGAPKSDFGPLKSCPGTAQGRSQAPKSSFYDGFAHVRFRAPKPAQFIKKRSGAAPETSGSTIFGQNRDFTWVLAWSRLLTMSLPNAFFSAILQTHRILRGQMALGGPNPRFFSMKYGARKGGKMTSQVAKTFVKH